jgi:hypothetical protein
VAEMSVGEKGEELVRGWVKRGDEGSRWNDGEMGEGGRLKPR